MPSMLCSQWTTSCREVKEAAIDDITTAPYNASAWDGERQEKVIAIQEQATEDILNAETVAEVEELVEKAQADRDDDSDL